MGKKLNGLLENQIKKHINGTIPKELETFMSDINSSYNQFDSDTKKMDKFFRFPEENPNPVLSVDNEFKVTYANKPSKGLLKDWKCKVGETLPTKFHSDLLEAKNVSTYKEIEVKLGKKIFSILLSPSPDRETVYLYGRDITALKKTESALESNLDLLRKKIKYESIINTVTQAVHHNINLQDVLESSVEILKNNLQGVDCVGIYMVQGEDAVMTAQRGYPEDFVKRAGRIPYPKGFTWKTIIEDKPLYVPDIDKDGTMGKAGKDIGTKSYASIPIHNNGKAFGTITINSLFKNAFDQEELNLLRIVARQIVMAINNAKHAEELEKSNEELQQFAYVASHDLQEPLRMVGSYLGLLEKRYQEKLDSDAKEFIAFAVDGAKRMQILINDLLAYSRVSTKGKSFEKLNFRNLIDEVLKNLEIAIKERDAEILIENLPEEITADLTQISQLIQNLVSNALKYCENEKPRIKIKAEDKGTKWQISIKDNGIGIEPEYFDRIFVIFQRLQTREKYKGTGIGLAICKKIVTRHEGEIWVESEQGKGSTFYFTISKKGEN